MKTKLEQLRDRIIQLRTLIKLPFLNLLEALKGSKIRHTVLPKKNWWNMGMPIDLEIKKRK